MPTKPHNRDPRIDAFIAKSADFAQPILKYLRDVVHEGCPQVQETIKWGMPSFEYKGMLCGMAAFKQHCSFGFWKHALVVGEQPAKTAAKPREAAKGDAGANGDSGGMGDFGKLTSLAELPPRKTLLSYVRKAKQLNDAGVKMPRAPRGPKKPLKIPADLAAALKNNPAATRHFADFSSSKRKDYIEWLTEAKAEATRARRLATAIEWIAEGKSRNWKYERC